MAKLTLKQAFAEISKLLNIPFEAPKQMKCTDGTIMQWEGDLKEGTSIMIVDEAGNQTPAPDKTYECEDGSKMTTVGGLVTKIEPPASAPPEMDMEKAASDLKAAQTLMSKFSDTVPIDAQNMPIIMRAVAQYCFGLEAEKADRDSAVAAAITAYKQGFKIMEDLLTEQDEKIKAYEGKFATIEQTVADNSTTVAQKFTEIKEIVASIAEDPAADPIQKPEGFGKKPVKALSTAEKIALYKRQINA